MSFVNLESYKIRRSNPRYVTISGDISNIGYEDNISIVADGCLLRRGDKVIYQEQERVVTDISIDGNIKNSYNIYFYNLNKSTLFISPFYAKDKVDLKWDKYFCSAYMQYGDKPNVYLMFRYSMTTDNTVEDIEYLKFEKKLCKHPNFINTYEVEGCTLFEFSIVDEYKDDINLILSAKYSEIADSSKDKIVQFHNANEKSIVYGTLYKTDFRKKELDELFGICLSKDDDEYLGEFLIEEPLDISNKIKQKLLMYKEIC